MVEYDKRTCHNEDAKNGCTFWDCDDCKYFYKDKEKNMTREELIKAINDNEESWSCPEYSCDKPEEEGNTGECCLKCAEKLLAEYEKHIYNKGYNDGVARQRLNCDDCFYKLSLKADAFKDCILENGEYCWQRCVAIEHCQECKCLGNGDINYFR